MPLDNEHKPICIYIYIYIGLRSLSLYIYMYIYIIIINNLNKLDIKTTFLPSKTIHDLVDFSPQRNIVSDAGVYCFPRRNYKIKYIGETSWNLHTC